MVDDGSTDGGPDQLSDLAVRGLRLISQANGGPGPARNRGISEANGEWIAFIDGDDLWRPDHLATLANLTTNFSDCAMVAAGYSQKQLGDPVNEQRASVPAGAAERLDPLTDRRGLEPLWTGAVAVRREALIAAGGFGAFVPGEDQLLWVRLALRHRIAISPRRTAIYFRGTDGLMDRIEGKRAERLSPFHAELASLVKSATGTPRHSALASFRDREARNGIKVLIYCGELALARELAELHHEGRLGPWPIVTALPDPLLSLAAHAFRLSKRQA